MYLDSNHNNAVEKVALFEVMFKEKNFFDSDDFELIIDYYLANLRKKIALDLALEQYPNDLSLLLLKVDFLNGNNRLKSHYIFY